MAVLYTILHVYCIPVPRRAVGHAMPCRAAVAKVCSCAANTCRPRPTLVRCPPVRPEPYKILLAPRCLNSLPRLLRTSYLPNKQQRRFPVPGRRFFWLFACHVRFAPPTGQQFVWSWARFLAQTGNWSPAGGFHDRRVAQGLPKIKRKKKVLSRLGKGPETKVA